MTFAVTLPNARYSKPEQVRAFYERLLEQLRSTAGVQSVAGMTGLPPLRQVDANDTDIEGYMAPPKGPFENVDYYQTVTNGYVETMGIPVVEGRAFQPSDANGDDRAHQRDDGAHVLPRTEPDRPPRQAVGVAGATSRSSPSSAS